MEIKQISNINEILNRLESVRRTGTNKYQAKCPSHTDNKPSLTITETNDKYLVYCHAGCEYIDVLKDIGLSDCSLSKVTLSPKPKREIEKIYKYTDIKGNVIHEKVRYTDKSFYNRHSKDNALIWNMKGITPVIYNLPAVAQGVKDGKNIYLVEGEKDADLLNKMGFIATTNYEGAGNGKFKKQYIKYFHNANVVVIQDNDEAGRQATKTIIDLLFDVVNSIKAVDLNNISKYKGFDITDYFDIGYTKDEFINMVEGTPIIKEKTSTISEGTNKNYTYPINNNITDTEKILKNSWYEVNKNTGRHRLIPGILAEYLAENVPAIYTTGTFYIYKNGVYRVCSHNEEKAVVMDHIMTKLRRSRDITDIAYQWSINKKTMVSPNKINKNPYVLNLKNGFYDIRTKELIEHSSDIITTVQLNAKHDPQATGKVFTKFINETLPDKKTKLLVQEMAGYTLTSFNNAKKSFILFGKSHTGKSTFLNIIEDILGEENISNVTLQKISDRFNTARLYGKLANIFADLPKEPLLGENLQLFKALTGDDKVQGERKGQDPFSFYNKAKLIFSCNELPDNYGDRTDAFYNRLIIIPFNNVVQEENWDTSLRTKLKKELDHIFLWAMQGLERLINNNFIFTETDEGERLKENYKLDSNPVFLFLNDNCEVEADRYISKENLYDLYKNYCSDNGFKPLTSRNFYREVLNYDTRIELGDSIRVPNSRIRAIKSLKLV